MAPFVGLGSTFEFATVAAPTIFTAYTGVQDIKFSGDKVSTEKTTNMLTTNGVDTYIGGTQDPGSLDVKALFEPADASQVSLEAIRLAAVAVPMKVLNSITGATVSFSGIVESITPTYPLDKPAELAIKIKLSGPKVYS